MPQQSTTLVLAAPRKFEVVDRALPVPGENEALVRIARERATCRARSACTPAAVSPRSRLDALKMTVDDPVAASTDTQSGPSPVARGIT